MGIWRWPEGEKCAKFYCGQDGKKIFSKSVDAKEIVGKWHFFGKNAILPTISLASTDLEKMFIPSCPQYNFAHFSPSSHLHISKT